MGEGLIEAIDIKLVELTVAWTDYLAYIITFTKVYYCSGFFINIILLKVLRGKNTYFNDLYNIINFIKNRVEVAFILYINGLNLFILLDDPIQLYLIKELPTKDTILKVS